MAFKKTASLKLAFPILTSNSPSARESVLKPAFFKPRLVIFDKDGTLICFHTMWTPWCTSLAQRMQHVTGMDLTDPLYSTLGYDHKEGRVRIGALAENTHPQIRDKIVEMLQRDHGFSVAEAKRAVEAAWKDTPDQMEIKMAGDVGGMFAALRKEGVKVAICTSDCREGTAAFLHRERLTDLVDMVVCGDDSGSKPKPDPHNAILICRELDVLPADTIMVGDTPADTLMGQQAGLGLTVGVLSGVGSEEDLADADVIVRDVGECVQMILPRSSIGASGARKTHQVTARGLSKIAQGSSGNGGRPFSTYSHIVVGAGSAGCVMANRLSEDREGK